MISRRHGMVLAAALVVGIAAGAAWPPPPLPKLKQDQATWSLPTADALLRHVPQDMAAVASGMHWFGKAGDNPGPDPRGPWRLAGIVHKDGPVILIMTEGKSAELKRIALGEALPDDSKLQSVEGDLVITKRDNCLTTYQLYQAKAVDQSAGCNALDVPTQGTSP